MKDIVKVCSYKKDVNKDEVTEINVVVENISIKRKLSFINFVVNNVVTENQYNLVLKNIIINIGLIKYFSDVDISDILSSEDFIDEFEEFEENTDLIAVLKTEINLTEFLDMIDCINKQIEYKTGIHENEITNAISSLLNKLEQKLDTIDLDNIVQIGNVLSSVSDELTMDKLVDAYSKIDNFVGNQAKVLDEKNKVINALQNELVKQL